MGLVRRVFGKVSFVIIICYLFSWSLKGGTPKVEPISHKDIVATILHHCKKEVDCKLLLAIAKVESNFNPYAISHKNAYGIFQITPIGLKDVRECVITVITVTTLLGNVSESAQVAVCLVKKLNQRFGSNKAAVLAAYNCGTGCARLWVLKRRRLPRETSEYVSRVLFYYYDNEWYKEELKSAKY